MVNFTCTNCLKSFKTTQHLNQHLNRKKPCIKFEKTISDYNPITSDISIEFNDEQNVSNLVEFVGINKGLLEKIKILHAIISANKKKINELEFENAKLKKITNIVDDFIVKFMDNVELNKSDY